MSIAKKLLFSALIVSTFSIFATAIIISGTSFNRAQEVIQQNAQDKLVALRSVQKEEIENYLGRIHKQIRLKSDSHQLRTAAQAFKQTFHSFSPEGQPSTEQAKAELSQYYSAEYGTLYKEKNPKSSLSAKTLLSGIDDKAAALQYHFIHENQNPLGEKDALDRLPFDSSYSAAHEANHPELRRFLQEYSYYDIFIIDADTGHIIYSVFKELDFATSLISGPYSTSGLAQVFKGVRYASNNDAVAFSPFQSYTPSYEDPAAFIASPIQDENGKTIAVLAFQMPIDDMNNLMTHGHHWKQIGLGDSGETYLVGENFKAQSISRFLIEDKEAYLAALESSNTAQDIIDTISAKGTNIGFQEIRTQGTNAALNGETGFGIFPDYRNVPVLSAYTSIEFEGSTMALLVEVDEAEAFAHESAMISSAIILTIVVSLIILALVAFLVWRFSNKLSTQLNGAVDIADAISRGDTAEITHTDSNDEIGGLMKALERMQTELIASLDKQNLEFGKIKQALDSCATNVMMADEHYNISYMNKSVEAMMLNAEADLKAALPGFDAQNLMGKNIDIFHKKPAHQRGMLEQLTEAYHGQIAVGVRTLGLIATPIFANEGQRVGTVVEWEDRTERLAAEKIANDLANDNARIKVALDNVSANVMVADADRNIIYANSAVVATLRNAQSDLQKDLPNFNVDTMMGGSIDQFHKNPQHQMQILDRLTTAMEANIVVGGRHMQLVVSPVLSDSDERLGTVVEWTDRTAEVRIQEEVDGIISAANDGDLSERIALEDKDGFFKQLSGGLNTLLDKTSSFVQDMSSMFESMSEGDLTNNISNDYRGEFDNIKTNANNTALKLTEILSRIQNASGAVRTSANEVAQGSSDLSRRTESQASSLEETASSMEEITTTVKQTSDNASQANSLASEAKTKAQAGGEIVDNAVSAMSEILESSNKINDIIGVIDEIAFQTNLLALNAAVEAARAGEQGRGFAVVAGEVRTLSQRSAAAAKEIKDLIRDSVNKVESGSSLVNQSGQTLAEIVTAVDKVATMISDVNNAAIEQTSGIAQINQAITQMDEMTQQNAALVEETSAASRSMSEEANNMNSMIAFFKMTNQAGAGLMGGHTASAEPIVSYSPSSASSTPSKPPGDTGSGGAASFSSDDDWEDF